MYGQPSLDLSGRTDQPFALPLADPPLQTGAPMFPQAGRGICSVCVRPADDVAAAARRPTLLDQRFGRGYAPAGTLGFERRFCASAQDFWTSSGKLGSSELILRCISATICGFCGAIS
jgi:hypothetical protein